MPRSPAATASRHLRHALDVLPPPRGIERVDDPRVRDVRDVIERALAMVEAIVAAPHEPEDESLRSYGFTRSEIADIQGVELGTIAKRRNRRNRAVR